MGDNLKIKKLNNNKYKIEIDKDTKIVTYDNILLKNNLLFKSELDSNSINEIEKQTKYYDVYNKVVKYITTKLRSNLEITEYLNKLEIPADEVAQIKKELQNNNLINDNVFVKAYIADKINLTNLGPNKIRKELLMHNIEESVINSELFNYDSEIFENKIKKIVEKKINSNHKYSNYIIKQKIMTDLIFLGYDKELVIDVLNEIENEDDSIIEKEFEKVKTKLSKKYTGSKLKSEIKSKLFQKGFNSELINKIIEKRID